jgi:hypothetical protein
MLEANSWGAGQTNVGYTASAYAAMHNVIWDVHYYGWVSGYSTNQATVTSTLSSITAQAQQIKSADGTIPIIIGEYGNSTSGVGIDPNATQVIQAVQASGYGYAAWAWGNGNPGDGLTSGSGLSSYGQQVAAGIAASAAATPTPTPTPTPVSGEITPTSGGSLTDASGNKWTLTVGGVVEENGNAVPDSAGTSAFALVKNAPYAQDASSHNWYTYSTVTQLWSSVAAPVFATPTPTPTPTPAPAPLTLGLTTTSGGLMKDASGNSWRLTGGNLTENGIAVPGGGGTSEVTIANNVVYAQDTGSKIWYTYSTANQIFTNAAAPNISITQTGETVSLSNVSIAAKTGNNMVFITGSSDTASLSGGTNTITDTGKSNTYVIPAAGKGYDAFTNNVLTAGDTLDLRTALASTNWTGTTATLSKYLSVVDSSNGAVLSISATSGGAGVAIVSMTGATTSNLTTLLAHSIT